MAGGDLTTLAMTVTQHPRQPRRLQQHECQRHSSGVRFYTLNGMDQNDPANNINNSGASNNLLGANSVAEAAVVAVTSITVPNHRAV